MKICINESDINRAKICVYEQVKDCGKVASNYCDFIYG